MLPLLLASITKPFTVTALMLLVERGQISLTEPVQKYLPEFQGPGREKVRVQDKGFLLRRIANVVQAAID